MLMADHAWCNGAIVALCSPRSSARRNTMDGLDPADTIAPNVASTTRAMAPSVAQGNADIAWWRQSCRAARSSSCAVTLREDTDQERFCGIGQSRGIFGREWAGTKQEQPTTECQCPHTWRQRPPRWVPSPSPLLAHGMLG